MRTHRPLGLLLATLLLVALGFLATGVAAAETGDGAGLVSLLERLIAFLQALVDALEAMASMG